MTTNVPFLNTPYGGYLHNEVPPEDAELTHVGPGTPAGEWFRRFWQPVAASEDLKDLPQAIRILDENLVVFRDRSGRVGLLELHCSHRGTSLEFGQIEERGIRCCYHAWLYDTDGKILETPGEPAESTLKDRLHHGAYPTHEHAGLVFAYMGPPEKQPSFPILDVYDPPGYHTLVAGPYVWPCNWLQVRDNLADPVHLRFLHAMPGNSGFAENFGEHPDMDFMEIPLGMVSLDFRRIGELVWLRSRNYILPNIDTHVIEPAMKGVPDDPMQLVEWHNAHLPMAVTKWTVPIDNTHVRLFDLWRIREGAKRSRRASFGQTEDRSYEERQQVPGDYDAQVSQRPIAIHALEHLAATDRGVIMMRNMIRRDIRAVQRGEDPQGVSYSNGGVIPTYALHRVLHIPPAPTLEEDRRLLLDTARGVVQDHMVDVAPL